MPTNIEMRSWQTALLFKLLILQKENETKVKGLNKLIAETQASMTKEDIAWVEKKVNELEE